MKYNSKNKPIQCYMKNSTCYKQTRTMTIKGILWHSTGVNNPNIKRYVQPNDSNSNKKELLGLIGVNTGKNDWNHIYQEAGVNAWIGKLANGKIATVQTMPWNYRPWGCGAGSKGSCNNGWIQFEICEDDLKSKDYFNKVYEEAVQLTAYLCKLYNINPKGKATEGGVSVPTILCHADSYELKLGTGHADVLHWFKKYGKTMNDVRNDVYKLLHPAGSIKQGDSGKDVLALQGWLNYLSFNCGKEDGHFGTKTEEALKKFQKFAKLEQTGDFNPKTKTAIQEQIKKSYKVKITANSLNVRVGASTQYAIKSKLTKGKEVTIVRHSSDGKWGKISNNIGWINLSYTKKV